MAHEIREHDHLMVAKRKAWHGLGTVVEEQQTPNAALKLAKLDWKVEQCPTYCIHDDAGDTKRIPLPNYANIRSDTKEVLGVVSDSYGVMQNDQIADMIWKAADEGACPKVESAGSLKNGRIVFFCCPFKSFFVGKGEDEVKPFITLSSSHDGTRALRGDSHTDRVVCANTDKIARNEAEMAGQFVSMRHTSNISSRIAEIRLLFEAVKENVSVYEKKANDLVKVQMTDAKLRDFFIDVHSRIYGAMPDQKENPRKYNKCLDRVAQWLTNFQSPTCNNNGVGGTAWAAYNAVTEWDNHQRTVKATATHGHSKEAARTYNRLFKNKTSNAAMDAALALV
jgi:phage/plasmid-like protein (TIGR03299 family)